MIQRLRLPGALAVLLFASQLARATTPAELYELPWPQACETELGVMALLVRGRDKGESPDEARATIRRLRTDADVSKELVANVFGHPELGIDPLERYTLWSCHARSHKIRPLPLSAVAADMRDCYAKSLPHECALIFQNRITGLAADFMPGSTVIKAPAARWRAR